MYDEITGGWKKLYNSGTSSIENSENYITLKTSGVTDFAISNSIDISEYTMLYFEFEVDKKLLNMAISKLNNREKNIMELRFGLISGDEKTQKEVADMLGISQSYISRLEKKIIKRLKKEISKMI